MILTRHGTEPPESQLEVPNEYALIRKSQCHARFAD
jgi:hypothetical protein